VVECGEKIPDKRRCRWLQVLHCPKERIWRQRCGRCLWWRFWKGDQRRSCRRMGTSFHSRSLRRLWEREIQIARRRQRKRRQKERGWWNEKPWLKLKMKLIILNKCRWNEDIYCRVKLHSFHRICPNLSIQIHFLCLYVSHLPSLRQLQSLTITKLPPVP